MDREIPKEIRKKERNKKIIRFSAIAVTTVVVISILISLMRTGVKKKDIILSAVDQGTIEVSVSASGKVAPAFEEIITSPINSRIVVIVFLSIRMVIKNLKVFYFGMRVLILILFLNTVNGNITMRMESS